jgi:hypothetical protein
MTPHSLVVANGVVYTMPLGRSTRPLAHGNVYANTDPYHLAKYSQ